MLLLNDLPQVGDIIWGRDCGIAKTVNKTSFKVLGVQSLKYNNDYISMDLMNLSNGSNHSGIVFHMPRENWGFIKHNGKTTCEDC